MIKILFFVLLVFALGFGFAWLADMPGEVVMTINNQQISISLMVAAVTIVGIIVTLMLLWWLLNVLFTSPQRMQRFFRARRRDRGYQSLSTGIIAAGAGDPANARKMLKQAGGLLSATSEPLLQLLDAQAEMLEGKHDSARTKFEAMLDDPELRNLGLRGLYMEAQRLGDRDAQKHYAEKAAELAPQLAWASRAALDLKTAAGDWDGAIRLLDQQKATKLIEKPEASRKRAVLLTAMALSNMEAEPAKAKQAALEAHRLAPEFAPAAIAAADAALRLNEMRRAVKVLETTWRKQPHPDVALAYVNARAGDSAVDRLKRADQLEKLKPNTTESSMIVAQMAMEAGEFERARKSVAAVLRNEPRESAFMLMADIEDAQTGDQGRVREWLSRAVRAPRDPAWTADGYVSQKWSPISPITGRIDAFEWRVPVEQMGAMIENDLDPMVPGKVIAASVATAVSKAEAEPEPQRPQAEPEIISPPGGTVNEPPTDADIADAEEVVTTTQATQVETIPAKSNLSQDSESAAEQAPTNGASQNTDSIEAVADTDDMHSPTAPPQVPADEMKKAAEPDDEAENMIMPPIPDDPGIDPDAPPEKPGRFRLF